MLLFLAIVVALALAIDDPFFSYEERSLQHLINAARMDPDACAAFGYCGHQLERVCGKHDGKSKRCSLLHGALAADVYPSTAPLRHSRVLSGACRRHLEALERCGRSGLEHENCDGGGGTAQRLAQACAAGGVGAFGETLAVQHQGSAALALSQWLCDFDGEQCAAPRRGLSSDTHRETLLDPTAPVCCGGADCGVRRRAADDDEQHQCAGKSCRACTLADTRLAFTTIGTGHHRRADGQDSWCVDLTTGSCDDAASVDGEERASAIYSGAHFVALEQHSTTTFAAAFWPERDDGFVVARLVLEDEPYTLTRQYPASAVVRGHYAVQVSHHRVDDCRAYHFEFVHTDGAGVSTTHRYPPTGKLMTKEEGACVDAFDPLGIALGKRASGNPLGVVNVRGNLTVRALNALERADRSRRGNLLPNSIAPGESVNVTLIVSHLGLVNESAAVMHGAPLALKFRYDVRCTTPGGVDGAPASDNAALESLELRAFNGTGRTPINATASDVGTFVQSGLGGVLTTRTLLRNWTNTVSFLLETELSTATSIDGIRCTATALDVLNEFGAAVDVAFANATFVNGSAKASVERRTDLVVTLSQSRDVIAAVDDADADAGDNGASQVVVVRNNGPIDAHNVVVGVRYALARGVRRVDALGHSQGTVDESDAVAGLDAGVDGILRWHVGTLAVGESASLLLAFAASHSAQDGDAVETHAFVASLDEKSIFIQDDEVKAVLRAERRIDLRVSHRLVVRKGAHATPDSADLTLFVENRGPSDIAVVALLVFVAPPSNVKIADVDISAGEYFKASPAELYAHERDFVAAPYHFWVVGNLTVGAKHALHYALVTDGERHAPAPLSFGIAVEKRRLRERVVLNLQDDLLLVKQNV